MLTKYRNSITAIVLTVAGVGVLAINHPVTAQASDSVVNDYITAKKFNHAKITKSIWGGFPKNKYRTGKPEGVVVHETANENSTIWNEIAYMKNNYQNAFVHSFVDAGSIINIANTNYLSWGAGGVANQRFVQFEQIRVHSKDAFAKEVNNASYYTAYLLRKYKLKPRSAAANGQSGTVWSHANVSKILGGSDHSDPTAYYADRGRNYFGQTYTMHMFNELVKQQYHTMAVAAAAKKAATEAAKQQSVAAQQSTAQSQPAAANSSSTTPQASSSSAAQQPSTTNTTANSSTPTTAVKKFAHVKYVKGSGADWANLNTNYRQYRTYNHVKNSRAKIKKLGWKGTFVGKKVYIDMKGTKGKNSTWYRIRYRKSAKAKKYWVANAALKLSSIKYSQLTANKSVKKHSSAPLRSHVLSATSLSKTTGSATAVRGKQISINLKAVKQQAGKQTTWYRTKLGNRNYWITAVATK